MASVSRDDDSAGQRLDERLLLALVEHERVAPLGGEEDEGRRVVGEAVLEVLDLEVGDDLPTRARARRNVGGTSST
jgi:hypothetical protein